MMKRFLRRRSRRWLYAFALLLVALPVGYWLARQHALPAYREWRDARLARITERFMAAGDYDNALLTSRQALRRNQRSLAHWRLAAAAAKAKGTPDVIYYQRNVAQLERSLEAQLELMRLALQFGHPREGLTAIDSIHPSAKQNPEFHRLAARVYAAVGRQGAAKTSLYSLLGLRAEDTDARLELAEIELAEDPTGSNRQLRSDIERLSQLPGLRARALVLLLSDAVIRSDGPRAAELAGEVAALPDLTPAHKVLVLSGFQKGGSGQADAYRQQLRSEFALDPAAVVRLLDHYRQTGPAGEAQAWVGSLSPQVKNDPRVQEAMALAFQSWNDFERLEETLGRGEWKDREFMRQALRAFAARKDGRLADAGSAWRLAVIHAGENVRNTSELLSLVGRWGWQTEQYDLVWKLFALMPRNEAISRQLIAWERSQGKTANLNRIFARLLEFSAEDRMLRNNFAYSSLLLDANLSKAYEYAQRNHAAEPENPYYVTTQALALYKQGHPRDALALLQTLRPSALATPERTLFLALFQAANGEPGRAADLLTGLNATGLLPEERRLAGEAAAIVARLDGEKGLDTRLLALSAGPSVDPEKGWLRLLPEASRRNVTPEMQTSDTLLAMGDLKALATQLRKSGWGERDHLRMALTAYAARDRNDPASARSYWRTALGAAAGDQPKLQELQALVTAWKWETESSEVTTRLFEINPTDRAVLARLLEYHRAAGRTGDMVAVLNAYVSANPDDRDRVRELAYYRMISGLDISRAHVAAQDVYRRAPDEPRNGYVYAFSLWKQRRHREAWEMLEKIQSDEIDLVPAPLLRAAVLADLNRQRDAAEVLKSFDAKRALPEEAKLATLLASRIGAEARLSGVAE